MKNDVKNTVSVVLATYNEELNIAGCLESIRGLANEIVIVDGTSSDRTVEIAKGFGARIIVRENPKIFHINKQIAIDSASSDWILQLDADERVTDELREEILSRIKEKEINGFWVPRLNYFLGRFLKKGGQYPDLTLRLYRRGKGSLPQKDVHEQAVVIGKTETLKNPLLHYSDPDFRRYLRRFDRYTDLIALELKKKKEKKGLALAIKYLLFNPAWWFVMTYFRHKGFMDWWQGFVFSFFSSLRFPVSYIKYIMRFV